MRWYIFVLLLLGAVWAGVVAAQRQLSGLPLAPSPASVVSSLREVLTPRLTKTEQPRVQITASVPILMYHHIQSLPTDQQGTIDWGLSISPEAFEQQLAWLSKQKYQSATMLELMTDSLPSKPIILTFDDGYEDFYTQAWPLLKKYGFSATVYMITNRLGSPGFLTADQITSLANAGLEIGSHSVSHPNISKMSGQKLAAELVDSRTTLRRLTSQSVTTFCYPSGQYSDVAVAAVEAAGYRSAVTTQEGIADSSNPFTLKRLRIKPSLTQAGFAELILSQSK